MIRKLSVAPIVDEETIKRAYNTNVKPIICISFDDGYEGDYLHSYPILQSRGIRATYFVHGELLGQPGWNDNMRMNAEQVKEIADGGHEIGCHTLDHSNLTELTISEVIENLKQNKAILEGITGKPVISHAYPWGATNGEIISVISGIYQYVRGFGELSYIKPDFHYMPMGYSQVYNVPGTGFDAYAMSSKERAINRFLEWCATNGPAIKCIVFHEVVADGMKETKYPGRNRMEASEFEEFVDFLVEKRDAGEVDILPFHETVARALMYQGPRENLHYTY